jgi:hypothetical protein
VIGTDHQVHEVDQVGLEKLTHRRGPSLVSATTTNARSPRLAGVQFLRLAGLSGWR